MMYLHLLVVFGAGAYGAWLLWRRPPGGYQDAARRIMSIAFPAKALILTHTILEAVS